MKTTTRTQRKVNKEFTKANYERAVRICEAAAQRIKTAGDDLADSWVAFGQELSTGGSATDLLRKRAWCNVLELRLKDQAHALEEARKLVDKVWEDMLLTRRAGEMLDRCLKKDANEVVGEDAGFSVLARTAIAIAAECRSAEVVKK
jgi:hypothetical protein